MTTTFNVPTSTADSFASSMSDVMLARAGALKGIDRALAEDLREKTSSSATTLSTITTTTTAPSRRLPVAAATKQPTLGVLTSPRVAEELKPEEIVETVRKVLGFTFPPSNQDEPSTFSGYILVSGHQVHWSRQILGQGAGSRITISLREERDLLQVDWVETKVFLSS